MHLYFCIISVFVTKYFYFIFRKIRKVYLKIAERQETQSSIMKQNWVFSFTDRLCIHQLIPWLLLQIESAIYMYIYDIYLHMLYLYAIYMLYIYIYITPLLFLERGSRCGGGERIKEASTLTSICHFFVNGEVWTMSTG